MGVERADLYVTADPVFTMDCAAPERIDQLLEGAGIPREQDFVVISVRDWDQTGDFPQELARLCDHLFRTYGLMSVFLLMQPSQDRQISQQVRAAMETESLLLEGAVTPPELMGVISRSRLCVAMRLHTLIFAARVAVPLLGLVYDPKVSSYLQELEMPSAGDVTSFSSQEAIRRADGLMAEYDRRKARLQECSRALTRKARENERLLLELLER